MPEEILEGVIEIKSEVHLQCPDCLSVLQKSNENYRCPVGHVELNTTPEGYILLKETGGSTKQLVYGENFREGVLWQKALGRCKKVVYLTSSVDEEDDLKPLRDYLTPFRYEFSIIYLDELNKINIDWQTLIIFSPQLRRKDALKIIIKYIGHPVYRYIPGSVIGVRLPILIGQVLRATLYKLLLDPIISRKVEACYERYLSDQETAKRFARTYLPREMQNGEGRQVFDIGCGRGRHIAMLNQLGFTVTGMDLQAHPYWGRISKADFIIGSVECLPYVPDSSFDLVVCMQVLEYLNDDNAVLAHIRRMLKQAGYLLLQVPNEENLHTVLTGERLIQDHYLQRYYKQSDLCDKLRQCGFTIDRVWTEKFYTPFFILPGNLFYEFVLNTRLQTVWDRLVSPRHLGLINILARPA